MEEQKINALPTKTSPTSGDKCLMSGAAEEYLIDYDQLATAILNKLTSKTYSLDQGTKTLIAALNELNSKTLLSYNSGTIGSSNTTVYNSEESENFLKDMYESIPDGKLFTGIFIAKRISTAMSPARWKIDGFRYVDNNGYIKIGTYANGYTEHMFSVYDGEWSWIS